MAVLLTGGAGYVGSHVSHALAERGEITVILDNLSTGVLGTFSSTAVFVQGDVSDLQLLRRIIRSHDIDGVMHFAGSVVSSESVSEPLHYYSNNTATSRTLIEACIFEEVKHFVFSSTAAVYGLAKTTSVDENSPTIPTNPYGRSKLMTEWMLEDVSSSTDNFRYTALRYFNVAGADPLGRTGQATKSATQLIKRVCEVALGHLPQLEIFGTDFPTPDGTAIRDYIHVTDLAAAHLLALDALRNGSDSRIYNCGYGRGYSVREVVAETEKIIGHRLPIIEGPRRCGDISAIIADATRLKSALDWRPQHDNLGGIINSALTWERRMRNQLS